MKLEKNTPAPDFNLKNQDGDYVGLKDFKGKKLFIYFYPKANTPGCTAQSCSVQESLPDFSSLDAAVIGISPDNPEKQKKFADKYNLDFPLLCDEDYRVSESYGVWGEKKMYGKTFMGIVRSSFLMDEKGMIAECWYKVSPKDTVPLVMKVLALK